MTTVPHTIKALSIRQPFASLWIEGTKRYETRVIRCQHPEWLLVHASKLLAETITPEVDALAAQRFGRDWRKALPLGSLIGAVFVTRCEPTGIAAQMTTPDDLACGDFSPGRWAWYARERIGFEPIPYRGQLALFAVPESLIKERVPNAYALMT